MARAKSYNLRVTEFRILGTLEAVADDGEQLAVVGQKQRAVLALLVLRANEVVSKEFLVEALWGEHPPPTVTASLQNSISALRKILGNDVLVTRPPGYVLAVDPESIDLVCFERLVASARELESAERAERLRAALALWRGEPLADLAYAAESLAGEVRRLEELRL